MLSADSFTNEKSKAAVWEGIKNQKSGLKLFNLSNADLVLVWHFLSVFFF